MWYYQVLLISNIMWSSSFHHHHLFHHYHHHYISIHDTKCDREWYRIKFWLFDCCRPCCFGCLICSDSLTVEVFFWCYALDRCATLATTCSCYRFGNKFSCESRASGCDSTWQPTSTGIPSRKKMSYKTESKGMSYRNGFCQTATMRQ